MTPIPTRPANCPTAIVIDDSMVMRMLLRRSLEAAGYRVVAEGASGAVALPLYEKHHPDLVILDVILPIVDGVTAAVAQLARSPGPDPDVPGGGRGSLPPEAVLRGARRRARPRDRREASWARPPAAGDRHMNCAACSRPNDGRRCFCGGCGAPLGRACPRCGFRNDVADRFCGGCGQPFSRAARPVQEPERDAAAPAPPAARERILSAEEVSALMRPAAPANPAPAAAALPSRVTQDDVDKLFAEAT
jgi:CheY-like chemotaxis protein